MEFGGADAFVKDKRPDGGRKNLPSVYGGTKVLRANGGTAVTPTGRTRLWWARNQKPWRQVSKNKDGSRLGDGPGGGQTKQTGERGVCVKKKKTRLPDESVVRGHGGGWPKNPTEEVGGGDCLSLLGRANLITKRTLLEEKVEQDLARPVPRL